MAHEVFSLETTDGRQTDHAGDPQGRAYQSEVELDTELASMFRLQLVIRQQGMAPGPIWMTSALGLETHHH